MNREIVCVECGEEIGHLIPEVREAQREAIRAQAREAGLPENSTLEVALRVGTTVQDLGPLLDAMGIRAHCCRTALVTNAEISDYV